MTNIKSLVRIGVLSLLLLGFGASHGRAQISFLDFLNAQQIGKKAGDFTLKTLTANEINMTKYREGKKAIIFFWATWCPHCRTALQKLNTDRLSFQEKDIKLILVDIGESREEVQSYISRNKINFDIFLDADSSIAESYGVVGVPTFFLVNQAGLIQAVENVLPENYDETLSKSK